MQQKKLLMLFMASWITLSACAMNNDEKTFDPLVAEYIADIEREAREAGIRLSEEEFINELQKKMFPEQGQRAAIFQANPDDREKPKFSSAKEVVADLKYKVQQTTFKKDN